MSFAHKSASMCLGTTQLEVVLKVHLSQYLKVIKA